VKTVPVRLPNGIVITCPSGQGVLRLLATKILFGKYKSDPGKEESGWTAVLLIMLGDDEKNHKAFKVYAGKSVRFDKFTVNVQRIDSSRFGMVVLADVIEEG
jgi:hypothetical protein